MTEPTNPGWLPRALKDAAEERARIFGAPLLPRPDDAEAVERMARAIFASPRSEAECRAYPWESKYEWTRDEYRQMARAALAALWEGK